MKLPAQECRNLLIKHIKLVIQLMLILATGCLLPAHGEAQRRPTLRPINKDYYAGKVLLIPTDDRPASFQQPRLIAEIADHELIVPPIRLLQEPENLAVWLESFDYDSVDGVILSLDRIIGSNGDGKTEIFGLIRRRRPGIPVYAFITPAGSDDQQLAQLKSSLQLVDDGSMDQLLIAADRKSLSLIKELGSADRSAARDEKVILDEDPESATVLMVGRMLNRRFGNVPRFLSVYSMNQASNSQTRNDALMIQNQMVAKFRTLGGVLAARSGQPAGTLERPDLVIYVHLEGTGDKERSDFIKSISLSLEKNLRVVLIDLSHTREAREPLLQMLRQSRLLDRLTSYAAHNDPNESTGDIITRAIGQASSLLLSLRFLRDDLDRVRRIDRAQIRLLISRYLSDFFYPFNVREDLLSYARTELKLGDIRSDDYKLAEYATDRIRINAEELFNEQFRRNIHAILLSSGERAQFEIRLLQRLQVRIYPPRRGSVRLPDVEITPSVYLVHLGNLSTPLLPSRSYWELTGDIDDRILRRWDETNWLAFKVDAESVEMRIKIDEKKRDLPDSNEGYAISNKLSRGNRRIEITARSLAGAFFALGRVEQLGFEGKLSGAFQMAEAPAFKERAAIEDFGGKWSDRERAELMTYLGRNRMNSYYFQPGNIDPDEERLRRLMREADENFLTFTYVLSTPDNQEIVDLDQRLMRLAGLGVRRFGLPTGLDARIVERVTERAKTLGAELIINPEAGQAGFCPWQSSILPDSGSVIFRPGPDLYLSMPGLGSAADYAWLGKAFVSENSYPRVIRQLYDERSLKAIGLWSRLTGVCGSEPVLWKRLFEGAGKGLAPDVTDIQEAEVLVARLREAVEMITGTRDRGLLRGELVLRLSLAEKSLATWKQNHN